MKRRWITLLIFLAFPHLGRSEKMNLEAHNMVIDKLETTLKNLGSSEEGVSVLGLKLQLANLYSEKSRLLLVEEGQKGCQDCLKSAAFRKKAIGIYTHIRSDIKGHEGDEVSLQLAHLLESSGEPKKALAIYNELIAKPKIQKTHLARAYEKRGGSFFLSGQFDKALTDFQMVLKLRPAPEHGSTLHKIAWAHYNKGELSLAIQKLKQLLKEESYLMQPTDQGRQYSEAFHSEVSRDLALFMAKVEITSQSIEQLMELSPKNDIIANLLLLGDEAERVGQDKGAPLAWEKALSLEGFPEDKKLPVLLSLARFHRDHFRYTKAMEYYKQALDLSQSIYGDKLQEAKCVDACQNQARLLKQFLVLWEKQINKLTQKEHLKTSQQALVQTYELYHRTLNRDYETYLWLGQLAAKIKKTEVARKAFARAADLLANPETPASPSKKKLLNGALLQEVQLAEVSNQAAIKITSYTHYLDLNPKGPEAFNVRYQRAQTYYESNQWDEAFSEFDNIVQDSQFSNSDLKLKAAHLALDTLVLRKDIENLERKSFEYSFKFSKEAPTFHRISRKAGLDLVRQWLAKDNSSSAAERALNKLNKVTLKSASPAELKTHLQLRIELALKAHQWSSAQTSLSQFLKLTPLSEQEVRWGLTKKLSLSELLLDFKQAYALVLKLGYANSKTATELLKGALLAELSGNNPLPWLQKAIQSPKTGSQQKALARAQLVRFSKNPWASLHEQASKIPISVFADLMLECYAKKPDQNQVRWALGQRGVRTTTAGRTMTQYLAFKEFGGQVQQMARLRLNSRTDSLLGSSLSHRMKSLSDMKSILKDSQRQNQWSLQMAAATVLARENERLALEIEQLPIPKKLNSNEKIQYAKELTNQARPFHQAASELSAFVESNWKEASYMEFLLQEIETKDRIRPILMGELRGLAPYLPPDHLKSIQATLEKFKDRPSSTEIAKTQSQLRQDPYDANLQNELLVMEKKRGNNSMVVFLQARSHSIQGGLL